MKKKKKNLKNNETRKIMSLLGTPTAIDPDDGSIDGSLASPLSEGNSGDGVAAK